MIKCIFTCVDLKDISVSCLGFTQLKECHAIFPWFVGYTLFPCESSCPGHHGFVNADISLRVVAPSELALKVIDDVRTLAELVITVGVVLVVDMEIAYRIKKNLSRLITMP